MTNTMETVFTGLTGQLTGVINGYTGIMLAVIGTLAALAIGAKFLPRKKKII